MSEKLKAVDSAMELLKETEEVLLICTADGRLSAMVSGKPARVTAMLVEVLRRSPDLVPIIEAALSVHNNKGVNPLSEVLELFGTILRDRSSNKTKADGK